MVKGLRVLFLNANIVIIIFPFLYLLPTCVSCYCDECKVGVVRKESGSLSYLTCLASVAFNTSFHSKEEMKHWTLLLEKEIT